MKVNFVAILSILSVAFAGCGGNDPGNASPPALPETRAMSPSTAETSISGEFRLVKVEASASVFVVQGGRKSAISRWGWVERNAPGKPVETITQAELDSYPYTGITYE